MYTVHIVDLVHTTDHKSHDNNLPIPSHVWYIYLHLVDFYGKLNVGKYTSLMDANPKTVKVRQKKPGAILVFPSLQLQRAAALWLFIVGCWLIENHWSMLFLRGFLNVNFKVLNSMKHQLGLKAPRTLLFINICKQTKPLGANLSSTMFLYFTQTSV